MITRKKRMWKRKRKITCNCVTNNPAWPLCWSLGSQWTSCFIKAWISLYIFLRINPSLQKIHFLPWALIENRKLERGGDQGTTWCLRCSVLFSTMSSWGALAPLSPTRPLPQRQGLRPQPVMRPSRIQYNPFSTETCIQSASHIVKGNGSAKHKWHI